MAQSAGSNPPPDPEHPVELLTLKDGRTLAYARYGAKLDSDAKSIPIFYFNGTPGCHVEANLIHEPARKLGIPLISTDRPGFGSSSWQDDRTLLDWPKDILELVDHLDIPRFGILGLSGGGPYALACLHALPKERLAGIACISAMYHLSLGTQGMMWQTRMMTTIASWSTWLLEKVFDLMIGSMLRLPHEQMVDKMKKTAEAQPLPEADKKAMKEVMEDDQLSKAYLGSMKEALKVSSKGAAWEFWIFAAPLQFKLEELDGSRLTMWHGEQDINVPISMPDQAFKLIPGADYNKVPDAAHVSLIVKHRERILSTFAEKLNKR